MEYSVNCPCGRENVMEEKCPVCGTDLIPLRKIKELEYKEKQSQSKINKKNKLVILVAVLVNLLVICAIVAFFVGRTSDKQETIALEEALNSQTATQSTPSPTQETVDVNKSADLISAAIKSADIPFDIDVAVNGDKVELTGTVPDKWIKDVVVLIASESAEGVQIYSDKLIIDESMNAADENSYINYTVIQGDTLGDIAIKIYGDYDMWGKIYEDNKDVIANPSTIYAGQVLKIYIDNEG